MASGVFACVRLCVSDKLGVAGWGEVFASCGIRQSIENKRGSLSGNFLGGAATCCGNEAMTINRSMPTVLQ